MAHDYHLMKNYQLITRPAPIVVIEKALRTAGERPQVCIGLDLELHLAAGAVIVGGGTAIDLGKHSRAVWLEVAGWLRTQPCKIGRAHV